ncbi:MAG: diguanylate cyclase (GGDEF)-like protein, partial [Sulfurimonas sp.]
MLDNIKLSRSFLSILILIPIFWLISGYLYIHKRTDELTDQKYTEVSKKMHDELKTLIDEKSETILIIAMSISNNPQVKNILLHKNGKLELNTFAQELKNNTSLKNIWFQVVSDDGTSLHRSWTKKHGDNLTKLRIDVAQMIQSPKVKSSISTGKFDLSFKSMVPLFDKGEFIGFVEVIAKFNSIAIKMEQKKYDTVILVDKKYKKQLSHAFTKNFVEDYYVANLNAKENLLSHIKDQQVSHFVNSPNHMISLKNSKLISVYHLKDIHDNNMSYFVLFHNLEDINIRNIIQTKERLVVFVLLIFFLIIALYYYGYIKKYKQFIQNINTRLGEEVIDKTKELRHIANHDDLTGLPNRLLFLDRLKQSIKHAKRKKSTVTVLFLDLDRFKEVNDTYGHQTGDQLLKEIANRLLKSVREEDTISRLGGDEFTVVLEDVDESCTVKIAQKILTLMRKKVIIENTNIHTTFSIGISR